MPDTPPPNLYESWQRYWESEEDYQADVMAVITLVPLVGVGSNQVTNSCNAANYVEVHQVDEHRKNDAEKLHYHLHAMTELEVNYVTICLYMSLQSLQFNSPWYGVLRCIASRDFLRRGPYRSSGRFLPHRVLMRRWGLFIIFTDCLPGHSNFGNFSESWSGHHKQSSWQAAFNGYVARIILPADLLRHFWCGNPTASITSAMKQDAS